MAIHTSATPSGNIATVSGEPTPLNMTYPIGHASRYGIESVPNTALAALNSLVLSTTLSRIDADTTNRIPTYPVITLPPGRFVVTDASVFFSGTPGDSRRTRGITIQGAGRYATEIVYQPSTAAALFDNNDRVSRLTIRDLTFTGGNSNATFMASLSNGGPQDHVFERVNWRGTWADGFRLTGTDVNSEFTFLECTVLGTWSRFLHNNNEQGLNYQFISTNLEPDSGDMLVFDAGGSINVFGGSLIGGKNNTSGTGTFFKFTDTATSQGQPRLHIEGARVEYRTAAYKLIDCAWETGTVTLVGCSDVGASSMDTTAARMQFTSGGGMPVVLFDGCRLGGKHAYTQTSQNDNVTRSIIYRNCVIEHNSNMSDFIVSTLSGSAVGRTGANPPVLFEDCKSSAVGQTSGHIHGQTLFGNVTRNAILRKRVVSMKSGFGDLPYPAGVASLALQLPLNAVITAVRLHVPAAASANTNTGWGYTLATTDTTPVTVFSYGGANTGTGQNVGGSTESSMFFVCNTAARRNLTLAGNANTGFGGPSSLLLVEYLA